MTHCRAPQKCSTASESALWHIWPAREASVIVHFLRSILAIVIGLSFQRVHVTICEIAALKIILQIRPRRKQAREGGRGGEAGREERSSLIEEGRAWREARRKGGEMNEK